jgi:DNA-binding MltR family transcriptional regulator
MSKLAKLNFLFVSQMVRVVFTLLMLNGPFADLPITFRVLYAIVAQYVWFYLAITIFEGTLDNSRKI